MSTYYINEKEICKIKKGLPKATSINCACGESYGYFIDYYKIIVCSACYEDSEYFYRLNSKDLQKILSRNKKKERLNVAN